MKKTAERLKPATTPKAAMRPTNLAELAQIEGGYGSSRRYYGGYGGYRGNYGGYRGYGGYYRGYRPH